MQVIKSGSGIGVTSRLPTLWLVVLWFTTIVLTIAVEVHFGFEQFVMTALKLGGAMVAASLALAPLATLILALQVWSRTRSHAAEMRERAVAQQRAHALANVDPLTGLLNRRGMAEELAACAVISEQRAKAVALLVVDLDHFKFVNDVHGHLAGDDLIRQVADRIRGSSPEEAIIARMGGDEFAIALAYEPNFPVVIRSLAAALVKAISNRFDVGDHNVHVGASIGLASSDTAGWLVETMLRQADVAMYRAKQDGRNRFCWFDGTMEADLKERSQIEGDLRTAIPTGQIVPYYQPQIDMETGEISGFEVLARWEHPTRGLVPPDRFIAIAEECGLISELSLCLMRQAMTDARDWASHLTIAVNISPTQLRDPLLAQRILKILVETRFAPQRLEIEITETALVTDLTTAKAVVSSLKNQGVRLALDDFGTGYSSLHHLRALPFDKIKIDRSFVGSMLDNSESAAIVGAVLKLGESLGMTVTAEGVETHAVAQHLSDLRCGNAQGWLYSKALTRSDAVRLLEPCPDALDTTLRDAC